MTCHIVLAHPEPRSFNGHLARTSQEVMGQFGAETSLSDLYEMDFDPREGPHHYSIRKDPEAFHTQNEQRHSTVRKTVPSDVDAEIRRLQDCDLLIVHFPLWWFGPPAILKGWIDRVFTYGGMYHSAMRHDKGVCAGKKMIACVTTGACEAGCAHNGKYGDIRLQLWPFLYSFRYLGFEVLEPEILHGVKSSAFALSDGQDGRVASFDDHADRWARALQDLSCRPRVPFNSDADFDDSKRLVSDAAVHSPFIRHEANAI